MNLLCVSGNLGKDAVVRKAGDQSVAGESGLVQYLKKGQFVVLSGELGTREHEGKTYLTLRVANVTLGGKSESAPVQQQAPQQPQQPMYNQAQQQAQHPSQQPQYFDEQPPF